MNPSLVFPAAIVLILCSIGLYLGVAIFREGRHDKESRRLAEVRADNDRLEHEICEVLDECLDCINAGDDDVDEWWDR